MDFGFRAWARFVYKYNFRERWGGAYSFRARDRRQVVADWFAASGGRARLFLCLVARPVVRRRTGWTLRTGQPGVGRLFGMDAGGPAPPGLPRFGASR